MRLKKKGKRSVPAFKDTVPSYVRLLMSFPGHKNGPFVHGIIGIINIHHFTSEYIGFLVKSGKDVALFCRHPNHSVCFSGHCQTSGGLNFLPPFWRACWLGAAFGAMAEVWGGGRESALYRSVFHALWLPCSRGRCSSVHRGPGSHSSSQKGAKPGGDVAGSPRSSLVLQL